MTSKIAVLDGGQGPVLGLVQLIRSTTLVSRRQAGIIPAYRQFDSKDGTDRNTKSTPIRSHPNKPNVGGGRFHLTGAGQLDGLALE
jgi:hypothetical protein